jgi:RNA polymerase sigma-70 factor (ECF subfamily)
MTERCIKADIELVEEVKQGNREAFSELVLRHQKALVRLALRFVKSIDLAEDVVQESFIKAYQKIDSFEGRSSFKSWLFQISVNTARNKLRDTKHDAADIENVYLAIAPKAENLLLHSALSRVLQKEVDLLPFKQRTALILRIYEDMSFKEIAQVMKCPYDTAKANYRHGLMKLRHAFEDRVELRSWMNQEMRNVRTAEHLFVEVEL